MQDSPWMRTVGDRVPGIALALLVAGCAHDGAAARVAKAALPAMACAFSPPGDIVGAYTYDAKDKGGFLGVDGALHWVRLAGSKMAWAACFAPPPGSPNELARTYLVDTTRPLLFTVRAGVLTFSGTGATFHRTDAQSILDRLREMQRVVV